MPDRWSSHFSNRYVTIPGAWTQRGVHLIHREIHAKAGNVLAALVVPDEVDATNSFPESAEAERDRTFRDLFDPRENLPILNAWPGPKRTKERFPSAIRKTFRK
jgi:hypothetical protein